MKRSLTHRLTAKGFFFNAKPNVLSTFIKVMVFGAGLSVVGACHGQDKLQGVKNTQVSHPDTRNQVSPAPHEPVIVENYSALPDAGINMKIGDIVSPYRVFSMFVLPGETTELEVIYPQPNTQYALFADNQSVAHAEKGTWNWTAPQNPGEKRLEVRDDKGNVEMVINAFIMTPADEVEGGRLKYYHIGPYPKESEIKNKDMYIEPEGFIEVNEDNMELNLSPHFKLKEFTSKQGTRFPKFVYLRSPLMLKLEMLRRELNLNDIPVDNMVVMSGYRTPQYNRAIGNVKFSRHVYGDAADIFVDNDGNYRMDDLNGDGNHTIKDAEVMAKMISELNKRSVYKGLIGGLGVYGPKSHRGAFIHIDTRGVKARWRKP